MKKIMFSERYLLEQAVLAGTKTQTLRIIQGTMGVKEKAQEWADMYPSCGMADKSFKAGANYVLEQLDLGNSAEEKFYKLDVIADIGLFIKQLKK